jgi:hypothetical protein
MEIWRGMGTFFIRSALEDQDIDVRKQSQCKQSTASTR